MRNKKSIVIVIVLLALAASVVFLYARFKAAGSGGQITSEISPERGLIQSVISTTGTVLPKNRLEVKPPVNGRVDSVLVREGEAVRVSDVLAYMSSTERAALLDAARGKGEEAFKYWEEAYKAIPLVSPIDGEVIVATIQPGQTVTTNDAVIVLSDHLIVRARVDETDIGKIEAGQAATIALDAYPDARISAHVEHIYYESKTINNVTVYEVDLYPEKMPLFLRSGMNATVDFIEKSKEDVLIVPLQAVFKENGNTYLLVKPKGGKEPIKRKVKTGISDYKFVEIVSGLDAEEMVAVKIKKYALPASAAGSNPFSPYGQRRQDSRQTGERERR